ncbi:MAG: hypothetical protein JSR55_09080 [Proteobacteria bacterium]|nr:hypothetical protein [Pseudomonadota bacterium]
MTIAAPLERIYDLSDLSAAGAEIAIDATPDQCGRIAAWLDVQSVEKFLGVVMLKKLAMNRYRYDAVLTCDLTQASVVTLDPLQTRIEERFSRELHVAYRSRHAPEPDEELTLAAADDDAPEEIESSRYDLASPLLEELSLALNPYPRAPEESFIAPEDPDAQPESPFAILKGLKGKG